MILKDLTNVFVSCQKDIPSYWNRTLLCRCCTPMRECRIFINNAVVGLVVFILPCHKIFTDNVDNSGVLADLTQIYWNVSRTYWLLENKLLFEQTHTWACNVLKTKSQTRSLLNHMLLNAGIPQQHFSILSSDNSYLKYISLGQFVFC